MKKFTSLGVINRLITDSVKTVAAWFSKGNAQFMMNPGETAPRHALALLIVLEIDNRFRFPFKQKTLQ